MPANASLWCPGPNGAPTQPVMESKNMPKIVGVYPVPHTPSSVEEVRFNIRNDVDRKALQRVRQEAKR